MKTEWVHKKLGECCNSELGKTLDEGRNTGSYRPYLCALNVLWGKIDLSTIKQMRIEEEERERYLVKKGDLLVCEGGEIGRCAIWESDDEIYYQNALHRVRFFKEYDARFFMYLLCHYNDLKLIEQYGKGLTIKHLNQAAFRNIPVCVPDLPAQRRIAAILSSADKVIDSTRRLIEKYKKMKQGMMEDLLKPKEGWKMVKLGECCETELGKTLDEGRNTGQYRPYLCALNVLWGKIDATTIKQMRIEDSELERYLVKKGDLLVCEGGEIGRCAIWNSDDEIYYQNALHRVRFYDEFEPLFFMYLLCYYNDLRTIEKYGKGLTIKHLNQTSFRNIPVSIPDLTEQRRIAAILSGIDAKIAAEETVLEKYEKVKKGMMERLLEGES